MEYTPVEENEDKKHENDPMETTTLPILEKNQFFKTSVKVSGFMVFIRWKTVHEFVLRLNLVIGSLSFLHK